jgi:N-acyl-D-amino-acid deacylase
MAQMTWGRALIVSGMLLAPAAAPQTAPFDVLIVNGSVLDGSGGAAVRADVGVRGGRVAAVGRLRGSPAVRTIDATGLVVAPGFIDVHTHADDIADTPLAENFLRMGVTSIVAGNCGSSALDVAEALARIAQVGVAVNYATLVGHNTVRRAVMDTARRPPTIGEMNRMKSLVWRAMADGAVGFSTGLEYVPGAYADRFEIAELAQVAGNQGGLYASHMRNEGTELEKAVEETIGIGRMAGCPVQISHLKVDAPGRWGASGAALALIDAARKRGLRVAADQYAYTAASSGLAIRFPSWVLEGGQPRIAERLNDPETWARIKDEIRAKLAERGLKDLSFATVASYRADPSLNGLSMKAVAAKLRGKDDEDAQLEAAREMMLAGGASMVYHFMGDEDVVRIMRHPHVSVASDSSVLTAGRGAPHPRGYGNNARVLGLYVRERGVLTFAEAVRKMTSLPAEHFRFDHRGLVKTGYAADLTLFDPATVGDAATFEKPHAYATGIPYVLVNGVVVIDKGTHTGARPGEVLKISK